MGKKTVYIVGNPTLAKDSMPLKIMPLLQKACPQFEFLPFESTRMDIPQSQDLVFIDTVEGAKKVMIIDDVDRIVETKACSLHDFDLGTQLKLLKKFGMLGKMKIIGVPEKGDRKRIAGEVAKLL